MSKIGGFIGLAVFGVFVLVVCQSCNKARNYNVPIVCGSSYEIEGAKMGEGTLILDVTGITCDCEEKKVKLIRYMKNSEGKYVPQDTLNYPGLALPHKYILSATEYVEVKCGVEKDVERKCVVSYTGTKAKG